MALVFYVSHPQVVIDPAVPVPSWSLSYVGRQRVSTAARHPRFASVRSIHSSAERKAVETAEIFATALRLPIHIREGLHENDRSSTGFLPPPAFEAMADRFFAQPELSIEGWERAVDAQARIVSGLSDIMEETPAGDLLVTGHGGVGTLLFCAFNDCAISRAFDQPGGGGNFLTIDRATRKALHGWRPLEEA